MASSESKSQRKGHGARMLALAERFAQERGCVVIRSSVDAGAVGVYERCGFVRADVAGAGSGVPMWKRVEAASLL